MRYYIGAVLRSTDDWREYIEITAPKNYKDPKKIAEYIVTRASELESGTVTHPLAGCVSSVCILTTDKDGLDEEKAFQQDGTGCGRMALEHILNHSGLITDPAVERRLHINGCHLSAALRLMAIDYMIANGQLPFGLHWSLEVDKEALGPHLVDPARMICGYRGSHVPEIPLEKVAKRFGLPPPREDDATDMAVFSYQLCSRLGL